MQGTYVTRIVAILLMLGLGTQAWAGEGRGRRAGPSFGWLGVGLNYALTADTEENCGGGGVSLNSVSSGSLLRLQHQTISFEGSDNTDTCDGLWSGDSSLQETSVLIGGRLGRTSRTYFAMGVGRIATDYNTGPRNEQNDISVGFPVALIWAPHSWLGVELSLFGNLNRQQGYLGGSMSLAFGAH